MNVVELLEYKLTLAEKICNDKFQNDVMLIFNNFSQKSTKLITQMIINDIRKHSYIGIILDSKLLRTYCTMYLGLAWSMYRQGKNIQIKNKLIDEDNINEKKQENKIKNFLVENNYCSELKEISIRYFNLYISRHLKDIISRMEITNHPNVNSEEDLKKIMIDDLYYFAYRTVIIGIYDEYNKS